MDLIRENMETEQWISAKPTQTAAETEVALPGGLREEARVYFADAAMAVNGGELTGTRVSTDGRVTFHVLYSQGDLAQVKEIEVPADFSQSLPLQEDSAVSAAVRLTPRGQVLSVSAKAFNGRLLRAILLLQADAAVYFTQNKYLRMSACGIHAAEAILLAAAFSGKARARSFGFPLESRFACLPAASMLLKQFSWPPLSRAKPEREVSVFLLNPASHVCLRHPCC